MRDFLGIFHVMVIGAALVALSSFVNAQTTTAGDASTAGTPGSDSIWSVIFSGGILGILIMSTLIALSVLAAYLVFDQAMGLRKKRSGTQ